MNPGRPTKAAPRKGRSSLRRTLLLAVLSLSLIPLTGFSAVSYLYTRQMLLAGRLERLTAIAHLKSFQIQAFFDGMLADLRLLARDAKYGRFLSALVAGHARSGEKLDRFVASPQWSTIATDWSAQFEAIREVRGYGDIVLIDTSGNILYSVAREAALGANLFAGELSRTRFAAACRSALTTGQPTFSDLELYAPSNKALAGFLVAVVTGAAGQGIGLIALQITAETIGSILRESVGLGNTGQTYLVGVDGLLRSDFFGGQGTALATRVETEQMRLWLADQDKGITPADESAVLAFVYPGPRDDREVLGVRSTIDIAGVRWGMFAEIDQSEASAPAQNLAIVALALLTATALLVVLLAVPIANRIFRPVSELSRVTKLAAAGNLDEEARITTPNEIGELAASFNHMLRQRREAESKLGEFGQAAELKSIELDAALRAANAEIAARKQADLALAEQKQQLVQVNTDLFQRNQELDEFTYIASHDLQEPLRKLASFCALLERDIGADVSEVARP